MQPTAIILRAPQRAAATVAALREAGIDSHCMQLIDTVWPADTTPVDAAIAGWIAGDHDWVVLTSMSTVQVLAARLGDRPLPDGTRIAAVGTRTAQAVRELLHRPVDFIPGTQSAAGMIREWRLPAGSRVLYPHGDLAAPTLADGLREWRVRLHEVIAYRTVAAGSGGEPVSGAPIPDGVAVLDPADLSARLAHTDLLVFAAPSIVRRFVELAGTRLPSRTRTIAIGQPTARALEQAGLPVHEVATDPTPAALAERARHILKSTTQNR